MKQNWGIYYGFRKLPNIQWIVSHLEKFGVKINSLNAIKLLNYVCNDWLVVCLAVGTSEYTNCWTSDMSPRTVNNVLKRNINVSRYKQAFFLKTDGVLRNSDMQAKRGWNILFTGESTRYAGWSHYRNFFIECNLNGPTHLSLLENLKFSCCAAATYQLSGNLVSARRMFNS